MISNFHCTFKTNIECYYSNYYCCEICLKVIQLKPILQTSNVLKLFSALVRLILALGMKNNGKISCFFLNFNYSSASLSLDISHPDFVSGFKNIRNYVCSLFLWNRLQIITILVWVIKIALLHTWQPSSSFSLNYLGYTQLYSPLPPPKGCRVCC